MTAVLWTMAFTCWSTAALLVVSMICPNLFQRPRARGPEETSL